MEIQRNVSLSCSNTLGFPSVAQYYARINTEAQLLEALAFAKQNTLPIHVLSGGSNVLMRPSIQGLVLHMDIAKRVVMRQNDSVQLTLGAGENWHETVAWTVEQGFSGLEAMALIPGRVGAAPVQNIGAYGVELCDVLVSVRVYDLVSESFRTLSVAACQFGYRDSLFKHQPGQYIITEVVLCLSATPRASGQRYAALASYLNEQGITEPSPADIFNAVCAVRCSKLPDPAQLGNAGSFFKNPVIDAAHYQHILVDLPDVVGYPQPDGYVKLAAGWLIERCGWKGQRKGAVGVYEKQALVLVHYGSGDLEALLALAEEIQTSVLTTFGVTLEREPQLFP